MLQGPQESSTSLLLLIVASAACACCWLISGLAAHYNSRRPGLGAGGEPGANKEDQGSSDAQPAPSTAPGSHSSDATNLLASVLTPRMPFRGGHGHNPSSGHEDKSVPQPCACAVADLRAAADTSKDAASSAGEEASRKPTDASSTGSPPLLRIPSSIAYSDFLSLRCDGTSVHNGHTKHRPTTSRSKLISLQTHTSAPAAMQRPPGLVIDLQSVFSAAAKAEAARSAAAQRRSTDVRLHTSDLDDSSSGSLIPPGSAMSSPGRHDVATVCSKPQGSVLYKSRLQQMRCNGKLEFQTGQAADLARALTNTLSRNLHLQHVTHTTTPAAPITQASLLCIQGCIQLLGSIVILPSAPLPALDPAVPSRMAITAPAVASSLIRRAISQGCHEFMRLDYHMQLAMTMHQAPVTALPTPPVWQPMAPTRKPSAPLVLAAPACGLLDEGRAASCPANIDEVAPVPLILPPPAAGSATTAGAAHEQVPVARDPSPTWVDPVCVAFSAQPQEVVMMLPAALQDVLGVPQGELHDPPLVRVVVCMADHVLVNTWQHVEHQSVDDTPYGMEVPVIRFTLPPLSGDDSRTATASPAGTAAATGQQLQPQGNSAHAAAAATQDTSADGAAVRRLPEALHVHVLSDATHASASAAPHSATLQPSVLLAATTLAAVPAPIALELKRLAGDMLMAALRMAGSNTSGSSKVCAQADTWQLHLQPLMRDLVFVGETAPAVALLAAAPALDGQQLGQLASWSDVASRLLTFLVSQDAAVCAAAVLKAMTQAGLQLQHGQQPVSADEAGQLLVAAMYPTTPTCSTPRHCPALTAPDTHTSPKPREHTQSHTGRPVEPPNTTSELSFIPSKHSRWVDCKQVAVLCASFLVAALCLSVLIITWRPAAHVLIPYLLRQPLPYRHWATSLPAHTAWWSQGRHPAVWVLQWVCVVWLSMVAVWQLLVPSQLLTSAASWLLNVLPRQLQQLRLATADGDKHKAAAAGGDGQGVAAAQSAAAASPGKTRTKQQTKAQTKQQSKQQSKVQSKSSSSSSSAGRVSGQLEPPLSHGPHEPHLLYPSSPFSALARIKPDVSSSSTTAAAPVAGLAAALYMPRRLSSDAQSAGVLQQHAQSSGVLQQHAQSSGVLQQQAQRKASNTAGGSGGANSGLMELPSSNRPVQQTLPVAQVVPRGGGHVTSRAAGHVTSRAGNTPWSDMINDPRRITPSRTSPPAPLPPPSPTRACADARLQHCHELIDVMKAKPGAALSDATDAGTGSMWAVQQLPSDAVQTQHCSVLLAAGPPAYPLPLHTPAAGLTSSGDQPMPGHTIIALGPGGSCPVAGYTAVTCVLLAARPPVVAAAAMRGAAGKPVELLEMDIALIARQLNGDSGVGSSAQQVVVEALGLTRDAGARDSGARDATYQPRELEVLLLDASELPRTFVGAGAAGGTFPAAQQLLTGTQQLTSQPSAAPDGTDMTAGPALRGLLPDQWLLDACVEHAEDQQLEDIPEDQAIELPFSRWLSFGEEQLIAMLPDSARRHHHTRGAAAPCTCSSLAELLQQQAAGGGSAAEECSHSAPCAVYQSAGASSPAGDATAAAAAQAVLVHEQQQAEQRSLYDQLLQIENIPSAASQPLCGLQHTDDGVQSGHGQQGSDGVPLAQPATVGGRDGAQVGGAEQLQLLGPPPALAEPAYHYQPTEALQLMSTGTSIEQPLLFIQSCSQSQVSSPHITLDDNLVPSATTTSATTDEPERMPSLGAQLPATTALVLPGDNDHVAAAAAGGGGGGTSPSSPPCSVLRIPQVDELLIDQDATGWWSTLGQPGGPPPPSPQSFIPFLHPSPGPQQGVLLPPPSPAVWHSASGAPAPFPCVPPPTPRPPGLAPSPFRAPVSTTSSAAPSLLPSFLTAAPVPSPLRSPLTAPSAPGVEFDPRGASMPLFGYGINTLDAAGPRSAFSSHLGARLPQPQRHTATSAANLMARPGEPVVSRPASHQAAEAASIALAQAAEALGRATQMPPPSPRRSSRMLPASPLLREEIRLSRSQLLFSCHNPDLHFSASHATAAGLGAHDEEVEEDNRFMGDFAVISRSSNSHSAGSQHSLSSSSIAAVASASTPGATPPALLPAVGTQAGVSDLCREASLGHRNTGTQAGVSDLCREASLAPPGTWGAADLGLLDSCLVATPRDAEQQLTMGSSARGVGTGGSGSGGGSGGSPTSGLSRQSTLTLDVGGGTATGSPVPSPSLFPGAHPLAPPPTPAAARHLQPQQPLMVVPVLDPATTPSWLQHSATASTTAAASMFASASSLKAPSCVYQYQPASYVSKLSSISNSGASSVPDVGPVTTASLPDVHSISSTPLVGVTSPPLPGAFLLDSKDTDIPGGGSTIRGLLSRSAFLIDFDNNPRGSTGARAGGVGPAWPGLAGDGPQLTSPMQQSMPVVGGQLLPGGGGVPFAGFLSDQFGVVSGSKEDDLLEGMYDNPRARSLYWDPLFDEQQLMEDQEQLPVDAPEVKVERLLPEQYTDNTLALVSKLLSKVDQVTLDTGSEEEVEVVRSLGDEVTGTAGGGAAGNGGGAVGGGGEVGCASTDVSSPATAAVSVTTNDTAPDNNSAAAGAAATTTAGGSGGGGGGGSRESAGSGVFARQRQLVSLAGGMNTTSTTTTDTAAGAAAAAGQLQRGAIVTPAWLDAIPGSILDYTLSCASLPGRNLRSSASNSLVSGGLTRVGLISLSAADGTQVAACGGVGGVSPSGATRPVAADTLALFIATAQRNSDARMSGIPGRTVGLRSEPDVSTAALLSAGDLTPVVPVFTLRVPDATTHTSTGGGSGDGGGGQRDDIMGTLSDWQSQSCEAIPDLLGELGSSGAPLPPTLSAAVPPTSGAGAEAQQQLEVTHQQGVVQHRLSGAPVRLSGTWVAVLCRVLVADSSLSPATTTTAILPSLPPSPPPAGPGYAIIHSHDNTPATPVRCPTITANPLTAARPGWSGDVGQTAAGTGPGGVASITVSGGAGGGGAGGGGGGGVMCGVVQDPAGIAVRWQVMLKSSGSA